MRTLVIVLALGALVACSGSDKPEEAALPIENVRVGAVMMETGRRLETAGRARQAGRWELAEYEVHEIEELFEEDLSRALLPGECNDAISEQMFDEITRTQLPALRVAAGNRDDAAFASAWRDTTARCNGCHGACRVAFVQVPAQPGSSVPRIEPEAPAAEAPSPAGDTAAPDAPIEEAGSGAAAPAP